MSTTGCVCGGAPLNSGMSNCLEQIKAWDYLVRVDRESAAGVPNKITKGTVLDSATVKALLNHIDPTIKITVFPRLHSIEDLRGEPLVETIDNTDYVEAQGTRNFLGFHIGKFASPQMLKTWESAACRTSAVYGLTSGKQIEGMNPDQTIGDLYPIKIQDDTLSVTYLKPSKAPTKQKIQVKFAVDETEEDSNLDFITSGSIVYSTDKWYSDAPIDVVGVEVSNALFITMIVDMNERFGDVNKNKITGLVIADFSTDNGATTSEVFNTTTSLSVALASVVEDGAIPGRYTLVMPVQNVNDIIKIDIFKEGLDMITPLLIELL